LGHTQKASFMQNLVEQHANPNFEQPVNNSLVNPYGLSEDSGYFWLKGNLHCHTINSDGRLNPQERLDGYVAGGFDFLSITDHQHLTDTSDLERPGDFILIPGAELHPKNPYGGQVHHFVALNINRDIPAHQMHPQEVIEAVRNQGGSPWLAHPHWSSIIISRDVMPLEGLAGVEVVNAESIYSGRSEGAVHWDDWMWLSNSLIPAIGVDDAHGGFGKAEATCGAWTMVRVREKSIEAVMHALETGASYASTGPEIHDVSVRPCGSKQGRSVYKAQVKCSPAVRVQGICDVYGGYHYEGGQEFPEASLELPAMARWVRIEVFDSTGRKAWSNPIPLPTCPQKPGLRAITSSSARQTGAIST
jgi:hypothetical protein